MTAFEEMGVMSELAQAVEDMDWSLPTDVQAEAIPQILGGGDVLMAAETGSGKTGAFCLPVMQIIHETMREAIAGKPKASKSKGSTTPKQWMMNMHDRGPAMAIDSVDGIKCQSRDTGGWHGSRATMGVHTAGKYYFEVQCSDDGLSRVGWSTLDATLELGCDKQGYGFGGTGKTSFGKQFDTYGEPYNKDDVIGCFLDFDSGCVKWSKNGQDFGKAYELSHQLRRCCFYPAICLKNSEVLVHLKAKDMQYTSLHDFTPISEAPQKYVRISDNTGASIESLAKKAANAPYAIIIEPSRELAEQTFNQIQKFKKHLPPPNLSELLIIGGASSREQLQSLSAGVDCVVATPGRLDDLISTAQLSLNQVRFFVLDEADGLLSAGNGPLIERIHRQIPPLTADGKRLQMIVCSATLHSFDVKKMAEKLMRFPTWIDLKGQDSVPETVHHVVCLVDPRLDLRWKSMNQHIETDLVHHQGDRLDFNNESKEMLSEAVKMLKGEYLIQAIDSQNMDRALIFCRTKIDCDNAEKYLKQRDKKRYTCVCLHGDRNPAERKANLEKFKKGEVKFLICTDVAARGIDIGGLPYVINVTLPDEKQSYVHRIGRVGRADRMGLAISLSSTVPEKVWYHSNCNNRGRGCWNTDLTTRGGCCIWYNEPQYLADIEEHLGVTIDQIPRHMKVPVNEFDGRVTYGERRKTSGSAYKGHVESLAPAAAELDALEKRAQTAYLALKAKGRSQRSN